MTTQEKINKQILSLIGLASYNSDRALEVMSAMVDTMKELEHRITQLENESNENRLRATPDRACNLPR